MMIFVSAQAVTDSRHRKIARDATEGRKRPVNRRSIKAAGPLERHVAALSVKVPGIIVVTRAWRKDSLSQFNAGTDQSLASRCHLAEAAA